jgi:Flp pilus assembly pilin Flp
MMSDPLGKFEKKLRVLNNILQEESGANLIQYGLILALVGLGATAVMHDVAAKIDDAFISLQHTLATFFGNVGTIQPGS